MHRCLPLFVVPLLVFVLAGCGDSNTTNVVAGGPSVSGVTPPAGPPAGGTAITISGSGFVSGATVDVGGSPATGVTFVSSASLTAITPAGSGHATVTVTNPGGAAAARAQAFLYAIPPTVATVTPAVLPTPGGSTIQVAGTGFQAGASVHVGGAAAVVQTLSPTGITAVAPPGTSGAVLVEVTNPDGQVATFVGVAYDEPPTVAAPGAPAQVQGGSVVAFDVQAVDPEGQAVELVLLNPPAGCVFAPASGTGSATGSVHWQVLGAAAGTQTLVFQARDAAGLTGRQAVEIEVVGGRYQSHLRVGDVTGDGILDVVSVATLGDTHAGDAGYAVVWAGPATAGGAPTALLRVSTAAANDRLGYLAGDFGIQMPTLQLCDVTGDGTLDVVISAPLADVGAGDTGAVYVWHGGTGLSGTVDADATLSVPGAAAGSQLGNVGTGAGLLCCDVTGDGVRDVVVGTYRADLGNVDTGGIFVWAGGMGLVGALAPTATLGVPGAETGQGLTYVSGFGAIGRSGQGLLCCDVLGDGTLDVIGVAPAADRGGGSDTGAIFVWQGGAGLLGSAAPAATLEVPSPTNGDRLGGTGEAQGVLCCDVTGDGRSDIVAGAWTADVGAGDSGAVYVFAGGATMTGSTAPTATLVHPTPAPGDRLGDVGHQAQGLFCCDVVGDATPDIVVGGADIDTSVVDAGAVHVWEGGSGLTGQPAATARLTVPAATAGDMLGMTDAGESIFCCDVTGDARLDIVVSAVLQDGVAPNTGAVHVWAGGSGLSGSVAPTATLVRPTPVAEDRLGFVNGGQGLVCCDVTGDLRADVVAFGSLLDTAAPDAGGALVWAGGPGLAGTPAPTAQLQVAGASANDWLGRLDVEGGTQCCDVTGDGIPDIVCGAAWADTVAPDAGAVYVWHGGPGLTGTLDADAYLRLDAPAVSDFLGQSAAGGRGSHGILCCDVTGDGILDLVVGSRQMDRAGVVNAGAICVWAGGAALTGPLPPTAIVRRAAPGNSDLLGDISWGQGFLCADLTGDGLADVIAGSYLADLGGAGDTGGVFAAPGGPGLLGTVYPWTFGLEDPTPGDRLGE